MKRMYIVMTAALLPLAILAVLMSCAGGGDGGYPSIFGTWKYEDLYTKWILEIDQDSWENNIYSYTAPEMLLNDFAPLQWDYVFGIRGTYTLSGDVFTSTLLEGSFDGDYWFTDESEDWLMLMEYLGVSATVWDTIYAISRSGNYFFQYNDMLGGTVMTERIAGEAVAAESYPGYAGTWQHVDAETRWVAVVAGSSFETVIESMNGSWTYAFGMRADYSLDGDHMYCTLTGGSIEEDSWFTEASDPDAWDTFVAQQFGGVESWSQIYAISPGGEYAFQYADFSGEPGAGESQMMERIGG